MKQRINFAPHVPHEKAPPLQAKEILVICLIFIVLLIGYNCFYAWVTGRMQKEINQAQLNQSISLHNLNSIKTEYGEKLKEEYLEKQLDDMSADIKAKKKIISILSSQKSVPNIEGFSSYFTLFASHTMPTVWLWEIKISNGGSAIRLQGYASNSKDVLQYVATLNATGVFDKKKLTLVDLSNAEGDTKQFTLYGETKGKF